MKLYWKSSTASKMKFGASGDRDIVHLAEAPVGAARHTPRVDLGRGRGGRAGIAVDLGLGASAGEGEGGGDPQGGGTARRAGQGELDGDGVVDALEERHGEVGQGGGADGVGQRAPGRHARVRGVHAQELVGVAEAGRLAVVLADLEEAGVARERARDVGCGRLAGADGHGGGRNLVLGLVQHHGVGAGLHGGRGEGAARACGGPVLCCRVVPVHDGSEG
ncbi:hypothetical protein N8I77_012513 [Diaporthe amygdali]|uniref:Uncharacterized protein n=1 Tax=Phomopsis amygdali TaxID=1214568 RepID=A0AAD9VX99_PHOAM|nr:hypothetical protein N8I77_012513 [Diaporthe amygdali]